MKILKYTAYTVLGLLVAIQLVPVDRSNPPVTADFDGPEEIEKLLRAKCYDCHSNESSWPWYTHVAPLSWWIADHVHEGREEVNFSEWGTYSQDKREDLAGESYDEMLDGFMPLEIYLVTHPHAKITDDDLLLMEAWLDGELD